MKSALPQHTSVAPRDFADGLGVRTVIAERGTELLELLSVAPEFVAVPAFEFALRERVSRLANFRHAYYARVRRVDRLEGGRGLGIVSEHATGARLSQILEVAERHSLDLDVNAALCLIRQIVPAIAMLHHNARDVAHGVLAPERILVTPQARIVITDYVLGSAVEQLRLSRERLWRDLQVAVPPGAGHPRLDHRADVMQIGVVSLSLILGRRLQHDELRGLSELLASATETTVLGEREPLSPPLRRWLARALQLDPRASFESAESAQRGLDDVLSEEGGYVAAPVALEAFLTCYQQYATSENQPLQEAAAPAPSSATTPPSGPVPVAAPASEPAVATPGPAVATSDPDRAWLRDAAAPPRVVAPAVEPPPSIAPVDPSELIQPVAMPVQTFPPAREAVEPPAADAGPHSAFEPEPAPRSRRLERIALLICFLVALGEGAYIWLSHAGAAGAAAASEGVLAVDSRPPGATVIVDGRERGATPVELELPPGPHVIELRAGSLSRVLPLSVRAGVVHSQYVEMPSAQATGELQIHAAAGSRVLVDGQLRGTAPLTVGDLSTGEHDVAVETADGVSRQTVMVSAGSAAVADFLGSAAPAPMPTSAPAAPTAGWVIVNAPYEMQVMSEGRIVGASGSRRIELPPGRHTLEIHNETLAFRTTKTVDVKVGEVSRVAIELPLGSISVNATPWAEVWIDGERVGETPIGNLPLRIGPHEVVFKHPELGEQRHAVSVTLAEPARLSVNLKR